MGDFVNLDPTWYHDASVYRRERERVWTTEWLVVAITAELEGPGAHVATDIAGWPVLVRRHADGGLRAFLNVCPHRGGPIAWPGRGTSGNLVCRYHGWAFDAEGSLVSARDFGADAPDCALTRIYVETWGPLVFVNLSPSSHSLRESLSSLVDVIDADDLDEMRHARRMVREIACNWKTYVDNYLEAYHVPMLHPLLGSAIDASAYRIDIPDPSYCVHSAPTRDGAANSGRWTFRYPNLALNVYPDAMNVERIEPIDATRTRIIYDYFSRDPSDEAIAAMLHMSNVTLDEDHMVVERIQLNMQSGAYRPGPLSPRHETAVAWFQDRIHRTLTEQP